MNNALVIGQYIKGNSWIYKIDPRIKILSVILLMVGLFFIPMSKITYILIALALFFLLILASRIPLFKVIKGFKPLLFMMTFTFVLQIIYVNKGELLTTIDFTIGLWQTLIIVGILVVYIFTKKFIPLKFLYLLFVIFMCFFIQSYFDFPTYNWKDYSLMIYKEGLFQGTFLFVRVMLIVGLTSILTFTTTTNDINNGLESLLKPLSYIKIPVSTLAMLFSLTLRFIPTLLDETNKIMRSQASRGVDFNEGSFKQKVMQVVSLLVPMFILSIERAEDLANAMEVRGYIVGGKRTKIDELKIKYYDIIALVLVLSLMTLGILTRYVI